MGVSPATNRLVWVKSGGLCAMPECRRPLVEAATVAGDPAAAVGEVAHIAAQNPGGRRYEGPVPGGDRDGITNLMLLCAHHHEVVDTQYRTYTTERLLGIKEEHERWVRERLSEDTECREKQAEVHEVVHSTLLPVVYMPRYVYGAPCSFNETDAKARIRSERVDKSVMLPFIVREKKLLTFFPLTRADNPFAEALDLGGVQCFEAAEWWRDKDRSRWYVSLLNRSLNKLTGRRGLHLDKDHNRYYFEPDRHQGGGPIARLVTYRPMNQASTDKSVAWRPTSRRSGELRNYWIHLAVGLRFHRVSPDAWMLSVRPEHRFTTDGFTPLVPKGIGRKSTRQKAHMYNYDLLGELQFWKEYLSGGEPRIIFEFGGQSLVVDARFATAEVAWPGVPGDMRPYANVTAEDDLFTSAAYHRAVEGESEVELEPWEIEDMLAIEMDDATGDLT